MWGACRLCLVEIGSGSNTKLVTSCTYSVKEGLVIRTDTKRVVKVRRMMIELMLSVALGSKILQDLASKYGLIKIRFKPKWEDCILCGLFLRMCH